ncbi:hypothetical protein H2198_004274 [Neophaeococcomyces mojaviensis]|uniref:Uncharacterized protein n=1 Tax=Neophaeococcomyces mojaviensis TaxID=3383035 RepID=A0ACC3A918_9EURO|nr:hypothetical protein H2198_004274 [Knufia sp. JES_112]
MEDSEGQSFSSTRKPTIIGLYGISGCGKTTLLNQLKKELGEADFNFYDGSEMLDKIIPDGLQAFHKMDASSKNHWRSLAIEAIGRQCAESARIGIVAGHLMFWHEQAEPVYTQSDLKTYTHIIYLDVDPATVAKYRKHDSKERTPLSVQELTRWQTAEITECRKVCLEHGILFAVFSKPLFDRVLKLVRDIQVHDEKHNLSLALKSLDEMILPAQERLQTVLVLDGDRTLTATDTGGVFWSKLPQDLRYKLPEDCLKALFSSSMGYSYTAFRQAMLLYEIQDDEEYEVLCEKVASVVTLYPEFVLLLKQVAELGNVGAVVVTSGLRRVWEKILQREGLDVKVIGGNRISDGFVVTAAVKAALVTRLQDVHKQNVWAFGDSPLDLEMLKEADRAVVVVGEVCTRSKAMDVQLAKAIDEGLGAHQVLLPSTAPPRLNTTKLPVMQLAHVIPTVLNNHPFQFFLAANKNSAKILATPTRDANVSGPALRAAHHRVGWYLATEHLSNIISTEKYTIPHVTGGSTEGYRYHKEKQTVIVALMRGGEPMALGVSDAMPGAMFVHAKDPHDLKSHHLKDQSTVILVDSVINTGKSIVEFLHHIRKLHTNIRIIVLAGVIQADVIDEGKFNTFSNTTLVALRRSERKFTGRGGTDTGNRLFNTTQLD